MSCSTSTASVLYVVSGFIVSGSMVQPTRRILAFAVGTADAQASSTVARPGTAIASKLARLRRSRRLMPTSMTGLSLHTEYDQNVVLVLHCQGKCCRVVAVVTVAWVMMRLFPDIRQGLPGCVHVRQQRTECLPAHRFMRAPGASGTAQPVRRSRQVSVTTRTEG